MDAKIVIDGLQTHYREFGKGGDSILLLHGWGQSHVFWNDVVTRLKESYHIYSLDLPGFGLSDEPKFIWNIDDYATYVHQFVIKLAIADPTIIGHSFGGRIAIAYASRYPVSCMVLYSTGGGIPEKSLIKNLYRDVFVKLGKYIVPNLIYKSHSMIFKPGSYDNTIILHTKRSRRMLDIYTQKPQDLREIMGKIRAKTLVITGGRDHITDPDTGRELHRRIKSSTYVEIPDATHFAHLESSRAFYSALEKFLSNQ
jgi:pimeloyl-ACP methyl ester carboxylesterase